MTPDQLTRLALLLSKAELTGSENQELAFLKSIATPSELAEASGESDDDEDEDEESEEESEESDDASGSESESEQSGRPSMLDHAKAIGSSKASLVKRNGELVAQVGRLTSQTAQLNKTVAANAKTIAELQTQLAAAKGELAEAKAKAKTVSEELAGLGVKPKDLPSSSPSTKTDSDTPRAGMTDAEIEAKLAELPDLQAQADFLERLEKARRAA